MSAAVRLENLTLGYDRHPAVHHLNGTFVAGSLTAVTGPNGAGKSTLLKGIAGIIAPQDGRIAIDSANVAYLPQAADLQRDFPISVLQMVSIGFWSQTGECGSIGLGLKDKARAAMDSAGLGGFADRQIETLSAGQFQRALFARLLLQDAQLILLDEPFTAVDSETTAKLLEIIQQWHKEGRTVICVLHDFEQIKKYFPQCLLLARQCVAWGDAAESLNPERLVKASMFREAWQPEAEVCQQ